MEDLLKEILKKLNDLEQRIAQIEEDLYLPGEEGDESVLEMEDNADDALPKAVAILNSVDIITINELQRFLNCGYARSVRLMKQLDEMGLVSLDAENGLFRVNKYEVEEYIRHNKAETKWN